MTTWNEIMNRVLRPTDGNSAHITTNGGYGVYRKGGTSPHVGIDFNYFGGQSGINLTHPEISSPVSGTIVGPLGGSLGTISIRDDNGYVHQILHTDSRYVSVNQRVNAGDPIGTMGGTGAKGVQHVHYQIWEPQFRTRKNP